ncbi:MFS transporter [Georgenia wutianyii]|uniref:MFS transporter n=1 Tax=Georgenia wutianyii TaxID=2585135 RepID=A0ABX5VP66_9MICO|nr:MFS transporter [Georgenia wutianyii]QDB80274.1 MFS transporter [Georgenia wutianyii]
MTAAAVAGRRAAVAVVVVFALNGFLFANWVSRLPAVRDALGLTPGQMGLLLLVGSVGSLLALPAAGAVAQRWGTAPTVRGSSLVAAGGFVVVILGLLAGSVPVLALGLLVAQVGIAGWDVAMNVEGGVVEHAISREIMPRFHAGFSIGTVAGAGVGAVAALLRVPVTVHLAVVAVVVVLGVLVATRGFLPHVPAPTRGSRRRGLAAALAGWREPRTVLVGVMVLAFALTEGAANDWVALAVVDGFETSDAVGAVGFGVFVVAMTLMRLAGERLLARFGRVTVLRATTLVALAGLLLFALSPWLWLAFAGAFLWGLGAALGFPAGMSAAGDEPLHAAMRVSVVASIGYLAFLCGPPLLGLLAEHVGYRYALLAIAGPLLLGFVVSGAARPLADTRPARV